MKRKVTAVASLTLATSIALNVYAWNDHEGTKVTPVETPHYVDKQAVINALSTKAQIVGLTGKVSKTIEYKDDKWYGDKTYKLAATGTFKLGVSTSDIQITTEGNTVKVKFPQPKIISIDMPYDKAVITKKIGPFFRLDLTDGQKQAMYGKARTGATEDIKRNRQAFDKAEASVERTIEALVGQVDNVKDVKFTR
jgi:hypothetical protein